MSSKNNAKFESLHEALLDHFIGLLKNGEVTHQELGEIRKFLLDNNFTAILDKNPKVRGILDDLPSKIDTSEFRKNY